MCASRATLLTGLYERTHRFTFGTPPIADIHISESYPALLKKEGYLTGFIGKFGVKVRKGAVDKMFDSFTLSTEILIFINKKMVLLGMKHRSLQTELLIF